jgi:hypothetical protein
MTDRPSPQRICLWDWSVPRHSPGREADGSSAGPRSLSADRRRDAGHRRERTAPKLSASAPHQLNSSVYPGRSRKALLSDSCGREHCTNTFSAANPTCSSSWRRRRGALPHGRLLGDFLAGAAGARTLGARRPSSRWRTRSSEDRGRG